jgi:hypothetical protein
LNRLRLGEGAASAILQYWAMMCVFSSCSKSGQIVFVDIGLV